MSLRAAATLPMLGLRRSPIWRFTLRRYGSVDRPVTASTAAHRTRVGPCLVIRPRRTLSSDSRCRGVSPAHEHRRFGFGNRSMSPISATNTALRTRPTPLMVWITS